MLIGFSKNRYFKPINLIHVRGNEINTLPVVLIIKYYIYLLWYLF